MLLILCKISLGYSKPPIFEYIGFCIDNIIPTKEVHCYPNKKPLVTSKLKALLNEKKRAFTSRDKAELKRLQRELKHSVTESKNYYTRKLERELEENNIQGRLEWVESELNMFLNKFNSNPPTPGGPSTAPPAAVCWGAGIKAKGNRQTDRHSPL